MSRPMVHFSLLMLGFFFAPVSLIAQVSDLQFSSTKPKSTKPEMVPCRSLIPIPMAPGPMTFGRSVTKRRASRQAVFGFNMVKVASVT